jgi:hypothetical protein
MIELRLQVSQKRVFQRISELRTGNNRKIEKASK